MALIRMKNLEDSKSCCYYLMHGTRTFGGEYWYCEKYEKSLGSVLPPPTPADVQRPFDTITNPVIACNEHIMQARGGTCLLER